MKNITQIQSSSPPEKLIPQRHRGYHRSPPMIAVMMMKNIQDDQDDHEKVTKYDNESGDLDEEG